jgi:hypothetical protein
MDIWMVDSITGSQRSDILRRTRRGPRRNGAPLQITMRCLRKALFGSGVIVLELTISTESFSLVCSSFLAPWLRKQCAYALQPLSQVIATYTVERVYYFELANFWVDWFRHVGSTFLTTATHRNSAPAHAKWHCWRYLPYHTNAVCCFCRCLHRGSCSPRSHGLCCEHTDRCATTQQHSSSSMLRSTAMQFAIILHGLSSLRTLTCITRTPPKHLQ